MAGPILMTEEYWKNSQFSVAQYYGGMVFNVKHYSIVNKEGITLRELSIPGSPHSVSGDMAIQPGEPCDMILDEWIPVYKALGRDKTIELVKSNTTLEEALTMIN